MAASAFDVFPASLHARCCLIQGQAEAQSRWELALLPAGSRAAPVPFGAAVSTQANCF